MKIGILSDSHDNVPAVKLAAERFGAAGVEHVIHAGDFIAPFSLAPLVELGVPVTGVFGNNDGERLVLKARFEAAGWTLEPKFALLNLDGVSIAVHHEPEPVAALAASGLYQVVVYGHTHAVDIRTEGETLIINPGETGGWLTGQRTVVVLDTATMRPQLITL
ncbi:MAG: metallophosphoesterase [Armatimonadetes bacterium]|nr:metallophosphoesterase [Armatimonadota bacterium]